MRDHTQPVRERVGTYGCTVGAAKAVLEAGGDVTFEPCPGAPAFFAMKQPVFHPPEGSEPIERNGPYAMVGFVLPSGLRITADYQHRIFRLRSGPDAEHGPGADSGCGSWGEKLTADKLEALKAA